MSLKLWLRGKYFIQSSRNDEQARILADRHYSRRTVGAKGFVGPGEALILVAEKALFVARRCKYRLDNQKGIECSIFRNESAILSSELIKDAVKLTHQYFGKERIFTYVNFKKIRSTNPGCCFLKAGFKKVGMNKFKTLVLLSYD